MKKNTLVFVGLSALLLGACGNGGEQPSDNAESKQEQQEQHVDQAEVEHVELEKFEVNGVPILVDHVSTPLAIKTLVDGFSMHSIDYLKEHHDELQNGVIFAGTADMDSGENYVMSAFFSADTLSQLNYDDLTGNDSYPDAFFGQADSTNISQQIIDEKPKLEKYRSKGSAGDGITPDIFYMLVGPYQSPENYN